MKSIITQTEVVRGVKGMKKLIALLQKGIKEEQRDGPGDPETVLMYRGDIHDVERVIVLLRRKDINALAKKIHGMDTQPRDEVLTRLGKSMCGKLGYT